MHYILDYALDCAENLFFGSSYIQHDVDTTVKFEESDVIETAPTKSAV